MQYTFQSLPKTAEEFVAMPEFGFSTPFQTAALFVVALCAYPEDEDECYTMIDALKGPQKLGTYDKQFIRERLREKAAYLGPAYFSGATPENNYTPDLPYTVVFEENPYTFAQEGYAKVYIQTTGADHPRPVGLRQKGDEWFLWEFAGALSDIRKPASDDPWL